MCGLLIPKFLPSRTSKVNTRIYTYQSQPSHVVFVMKTHLFLQAGSGAWFGMNGAVELFGLSKFFNFIFCT